MDHQDHVFLLRDGVRQRHQDQAASIWADFGSGSGAFTLALADLLGPAGEIISVERDRTKLRQQQRTLASNFPDVKVSYLEDDFTGPLSLPPLDGLVAANTLHFFKRKEPVIEQLLSCLKPGGRFIVVEYNSDRGNHWVPYPFSFNSWLALAERAGLVRTELLAAVPSSFLGEIYAALSHNPI